MEQFHSLHTPRVTGRFNVSSGPPRKFAFTPRRTLESSRAKTLGAARPVAAKRRARAAMLGIMLAIDEVYCSQRSVCSGSEMKNWKSLLSDSLCGGKRQYIYVFEHLHIPFNAQGLSSYERHPSSCKKTMISSQSMLLCSAAHKTVLVRLQILQNHAAPLM